MAVRLRAGEQRAFARGVKPVVAVALRQPQDTEAWPISLLRMPPLDEDGLDKNLDVRADFRRPTNQPRWRPLQMRLMRLWHVLVLGRMPTWQTAPDVGGDAAIPVEDLDGRGCHAHVDELAHQCMRDRVPVLVHLCVVVDVDSRLLPLGVDEALRRQRLQRELVRLCKELGARLSAVGPHRPRVQLIEEDRDALIQRIQREEDFVTHSSEDPPLYDLDGDLDLGLVFRALRPRGQHRRPVVAGHLLVRSLDLGIVPARRRHAALELVGHRERGSPAEELEGADVALNEVDALLRPRRLRICVVRRAKHSDEELHLRHLAGLLVDDGRLLPRVVDEHLFASDVRLTHRQPSTIEPAAIVLAELRVAIPVGVLLQILNVKKLQRDARTLSLDVDLHRVRCRPRRRRRQAWSVELYLQRIVVELRRRRPVEFHRRRS